MDTHAIAFTPNALQMIAISPLLRYQAAPVLRRLRVLQGFALRFVVIGITHYLRPFVQVCRLFAIVNEQGLETLSPVAE